MSKFRAECLGCPWSLHPQPFAETVELLQEHRTGTEHAVKMRPAEQAHE